MPPWYLYILECVGDVLYVGITTNLGRRFASHAAGKGGAFTRANPPVRLLAAEELPDRASATRAEMALKKLPRPRKLRWAAEHAGGLAVRPERAEERTMTAGTAPFKRIDHFEVVPSDVARTLHFYQEILGFRLKNRYPVAKPPMREVIYLTLGDTMLEVIDVDGPASAHADPWHVGWRGMALEVPDMAVAVAYLAERGVVPTVAPVDLGTSLRAEIQDPDGLMIELRQWK